MHQGSTRAHRRRPFRWIAAVTGAWLTWMAGCTGIIGDGQEGANGTGGPGSETEATCSPTADPIRRLTPVEYTRSVAQLFPGVALPPDAPIVDSRVNGFTNQSAGQSISDLGVQRYAQLATDIGEAASTQRDLWAPCTDDSATCAQTIANELAFRAYRRPVLPDEEDALNTFAAEVHGEFGMEEGVALIVQGLLESPSFLFRPEFAAGDAGEDGTVALTDYEMAGRLSFFFLDTMPDDELFAAAAAGELATDEGLEAHARRLMAMPEARDVLTGFMSEWLGLYRLDTLSLDADTFPEFGDELRADLEASARMYLDKTLWDDDSFDSLYGGEFAFVNDRLAPIFGVDAPGSDELVLVELDPSRRRGILTQPALLAATSHGISHSPILRGVSMLDSVMCSPVPAPPPGILDDLDDVELPPEEVCTTRDQVAKTHTVGADCQACHNAIDGAGFAFENYDALGRYRTTENGCDIDSTGSFPAPIGEVDSAVHLAEQLSESREAAACLTAHAFRFALGRVERQGDNCQIDSVTETIITGDKSLQELIVQLVLSNSFRRRPQG